MPSLQRHNLHSWNLTPSAAVALQTTLAQKLISDTPLELGALNLIAGVDVSVKAGISRAAIVAMRFPDLAIVDISLASLPTPYPYIPGLLSFREGQVILKAYETLQLDLDVLIFDGQGQIHPRRLGIAAHIGLWLDRPTIGCAKTPYIGHHADVGVQKGSYQPVYGNSGGTMGVALRTREAVKPVYVSPGHRCDLDSARLLVIACTTRFRLPEPIRAAHRAAGSL